MSTPLPLAGLYLHLVRNGLPLSVRDFQEALTALGRGHGTGERDALRRLCDALWCRSEHESILLERLFRELPPPDSRLVEELTGAGGEPTPAPAVQESPMPSSMGSPRETADDNRTRVAFGAANESGTALPHAALANVDERFIFTARPVISLRSLIVGWRRFRLAKRSGPAVELDVAATVAELGRRGRVAAPVLVPARRNQVRLIVLVDASPSMMPWRTLNPLLQESLRASGFADAPLYFFDNVPRDVVYERDALTHPIPVRDLHSRHPSGALLVVSDAGAARGRTNRGRAGAWRRFVATAQDVWSPVAWLNPMPKPRWSSSTSAMIGRIPGVQMTELTDDGLIAAVDFLRGKTAAVA